MKLKLKYLSLLAGASLMFSSCEDFLDKPAEDAISVENYLTSKDNLEAFTNQVYGAFGWNNYEDKFSWCAGELMAGNVYHNFGDEGQFFYLNFNSTNSILANGYDGLYSIIGRCNMLIHEMPAIAEKNGLAKDDINKAKGEAYLYRAVCYFLITEYWGPAYIVTNNTNIIASDLASSIPLSNRASVYAQIEKDLNEAYNLLPTAKWGKGGRKVTKYSAKGLLAKLYATMASCQREIAGPNNYVCPDYKAYYQKAIDAATEVINSGVYQLEGTDTYEDIFMTRHNKEILIALEMEKGEYGAGSSRQIQFSRSKFLNQDGNSYGGEKGLSPNLFNSFDEDDIRKKACSYYTTRKGDNDNNPKNPVYKLYDGSEYVYWLNPNDYFSKEALANKADGCFGQEARGAVLNHCRKFVYNKPFINEFACEMTLPILRLADIYLLRAESKMALENSDVSAFCSDGFEDISKIKTRAGWVNEPKYEYYIIKTNEETGEKVEEPCSKDTEGAIERKVSDAVSTFSFYTPDPEKEITVYDETGDLHVLSKRYTYTDDLMGERAKEFALECQSWLDVKRLYYRNEEAAKGFLRERDRAWFYGIKLNFSGKALAKDNYQRQRDIFELSKQVEGGTVQNVEPPVDIEGAQWFLPLPSTVDKKDTPVDNKAAIESGEYQY